MKHKNSIPLCKDNAYRLSLSELDTASHPGRIRWFQNGVRLHVALVFLIACGTSIFAPAAQASNSGSGGVGSAGGHAKIPVPPPRNCGPMTGRATWPSQIEKEYERIGGPSSPIGCPLSDFAHDGPVPIRGRGFVQFERGQIAISTDVWGDGVVAAYQDDWCAGDGSCANGAGRIVVDWNTSWTEPSPFSFNKFLVRWDVNGTHHDDGNACDRGDGDQCDVLADMTAVQLVLLHWYHDTHLYTKGTFTVPTNRGDGAYRISVKGCNEGTGALGGDSCQPAWMHPVEVVFKQGNVGDFAFPIDLTSVPSVEPNSNWLQKQEAFFQRAAAITRYYACRVLPWKAYQNEQTYGDLMLAKLAYSEFYNEDHCPGRVTSNRVEAFASLLQQTIESKTGTTIDECGNPLKLSCRTGEYDVALSGYVAALSQFGSVLPANVSDHILNGLLNKRGPLDSGDLVVHVAADESENHINLIESAQYITNDLLFEKTGDANYNNDANGMTGWWLSRLRGFLTTDFIEYNARPYQSYTAIALQNLFSFAHNQDVKTAAGMVLDYISAKMAMSSNQARRAVPYRRKASYNTPFLLAWEADTQAARNLALVGNLDILSEGRPRHTVLLGPGESPYWGPAYGGGDMLRALLSSYRIPDLLFDLIINPAHRLFYQGLHHYSDELYAGSPSFLISAGGHYADPAYSVLGVFSSGDDIGKALPTTIMPTGRFINRDELVQFKGADDDTARFNMCVAPNFACGINPVIPPNLKPCTAPPTSRLTTNWTFINFNGTCSGGSAPFGFYLAVYQNLGTAAQFGLAEVFDTMVNPNFSFQAFKDGVVKRNPHTFSAFGDTYVTTTGQVIQFTIAEPPFLIASRILSITNGPQLPSPGFVNTVQMPMAFGNLVSSQWGSGVITITNSYLGNARTLDFHDVAHPVVIDLGVPAFTNSTCLPGFVWRQANPGDAVCVTQATLLDIQTQNALGASRTDPNYLIHRCLPGFVDRDADGGDNVCVTQAEHDQASSDNLLAPSRRAIP